MFIRNPKIEVIAVDFDGTIFEDEWPYIGRLIPIARSTINQFRMLGGKVIIWTCREGENLDRAVKALRESNVTYDAVNKNIKERIKQYGNDCRKVGADLYIDDKTPGGPNWELARKIIFKTGAA